MTAHAVLFGDPDKTACNLRLSQKPGRTAAALPYDIDCDVCSLRVLRSMQAENPVVLAAALPNTWPAGLGNNPPKD